VCVMAANNETGVLQPMAEISELAHRHGALVHCDAVQAVGKIPVDVMTWGVDYLALSGHKIGGPQGIGSLVRCGDAPLSSLISGGGQEHGLRAGTENVAAISGLGVAAQIAADTLAEKSVRLKGYRDALEAGIKALSPTTMIFCEEAPRLPNTSNFTLPGVRSDRQLMALDLAGVSVSAGSACSAGKVEPSHVLDSMAVDPEISTTALRASFGWSSEAVDVDRFLDAWGDLARRESAGVLEEISAA
ncbi:MAG: aminotransferase class V-fold PLP-dependent enzyme, partial [Rhodospirillaceae bacterium]|nr:aminotransferase class V-fold PLP-dependent enzyme [Rhodospirillaceae bacterium]